MNWERHAVVSEMLIVTAETLAQNPPTALAAGELVWGAMFHACGAAERHPAERHREPRTRRELREIVNHLVVDRRTRSDWLRGIDAAVRRLHDNFYSGELNDRELAEDLLIGTSFVRRMLQVARQL